MDKPGTYLSFLIKAVFEPLSAERLHFYKGTNFTIFWFNNSTKLVLLQVLFKIIIDLWLGSLLFPNRPSFFLSHEPSVSPHREMP